MKQRDINEMLRRRGQQPVSSKNWHSLNEMHILGPGRMVHQNDLRLHLVLDHGISVKDSKTPAQLGRLHLLAHALLAHPELQQLIGTEPKKAKKK